MTSDLLIVVAVAAVAVILTVLLIPVAKVRAVALAIAFLISAFSVNITATQQIYLPSMGLAILVLVIAVLRARPPRSQQLPLQFALALWWAVILISTLVMQGRPLTGLLIYGTLALLASHVALRLDHASVRLFVRILLVVMVAEVVLGSITTLTSSTPLWGYRGDVRMNPLLSDNYPRAQGTFGHPIVFGWFMAICTVLAWTNVARLSRRMHILVLVIAAAGLAFSGTRSALLSAGVGIMLHIVARPGLSRWLRNVMIAVGVALVALLAGLGSTIESLASDLVDSGSWIQRLGNIASVPTLMQRPPMEMLFGLGWGRDAALFDKGYLYSPYNLSVVDNMYVEALGTVGLVGLLVLLVGIVFALIRGDRGSRAVTLAVLAMMFSFDTWVWLFTGVAATIFLSLPRLNKEQPERSSTPTSVELEEAAYPHLSSEGRTGAPA